MNRFETYADLPGQATIHSRPAPLYPILATLAGAAWPPLLLTLPLWPPNPIGPGRETDWRLMVLLIGLVVGGERTMLGPILGGLIVVFLPYYTSDLGGGQFSAVLFAIVLIAVVFVAPDGIAGGLGRVIAKFVRIEARRPEGRDGGLLGTRASDPEPAADPGAGR